MPKETVTPRIEPETRETYQWKLEHILQGLREAEAGNFVPEAKVKRVIARLQRKAPFVGRRTALRD